MKGKGMQLGGGKANARLKMALSNEIGIADDNASRSPLASSATASEPATGHTPPSVDGGIEVSLIETSVAKANRDGNVESLEVQGQLNLHISDSSISRVQIEVNSDDSDGTQFKSHPNVDRNLFKEQHKIGLRDSSRSFPLNQQMSVLRWRLQSKDNITLPISGFGFRVFMLIPVNCWPSPLGDGTTDVNIEYEADLNKSSIEDVIITIPFPVYVRILREC
jgi:coatomer subunit delta